MFRLGPSRTREEVCGELELPEQVESCIADYRAGVPATLVRSARITDRANPAYRADGSARMCVAACGLEARQCLGCFPGSGEQSQRRPTGVFEEAYAYRLEGGRGWLVPRQRDRGNPFCSSNDFRTDLARPAGPQGRESNMHGVEIWKDGGAYLVFYTLRAVAEGHELLWDYGEACAPPRPHLCPRSRLTPRPLRRLGVEGDDGVPPGARRGAGGARAGLSRGAAAGGGDVGGGVRSARRAGLGVSDVGGAHGDGGGVHPLHSSAGHAHAAREAATRVKEDSTSRTLSSAAAAPECRREPLAAPPAGSAAS